MGHYVISFFLAFRIHYSPSLAWTDMFSWHLSARFWHSSSLWSLQLVLLWKPCVISAGPTTSILPQAQQWYVKFSQTAAATDYTSLDCVHPSLPLQRSHELYRQKTYKNLFLGWLIVSLQSSGSQVSKCIQRQTSRYTFKEVVRPEAFTILDVFHHVVSKFFNMSWRPE